MRITVRVREHTHLKIKKNPIRRQIVRHISFVVYCTSIPHIYIFSIRIFDIKWMWITSWEWDKNELQKNSNTPSNNRCRCDSLDLRWIRWIFHTEYMECVFIVWFTDASYSHSFIFLRVFFPLREHFYTPINSIFTARIRVDFVSNKFFQQNIYLCFQWKSRFLIAAKIYFGFNFIVLKKEIFSIKMAV